MATRSGTVLALALFGLLATLPAHAQVEAEAYAGVTASRILFQENCAVCHGENLEGAPQGTPLRGPLRRGEAVTEIVAGISDGYPDSAMPAWRAVFSADQVRGLALYILETRANLNYVTSNFDAQLTIPEKRRLRQGARHQRRPVYHPAARRRPDSLPGDIELHHCYERPLSRGLAR